MLPRLGKAKGAYHQQVINTWNVKGTYLRKRRSKTWTVKWQQTHNYQQLNLKNENKLSKQLEQEQNHRYGDHVEGYQQGGGRGKVEKRYRV